MNSMTATKIRAPYRPRPLTTDQQRKIAIAKAHLAKRQKVDRIRAGLQRLIEAGEREWERRRVASVGGGGDVPQLLLDVIAIETDFDALCKDIA